MKFETYSIESSLYQQSLVLRNQYLRVPLGLTLSETDLMGEENQMHCGLVDRGQLAACVVLKEISPGRVKLRQMVVDRPRRGQGLGRELIRQVETLAKTKGTQFVEMSARLETKGFYEKLGYVNGGKVFIKVGIQHIKMSKCIC